MESAESPLSDAGGHPDADLLATPRKAVTPPKAAAAGPGTQSRILACRVAANDRMWPAERGRRCRSAPAYYGFGPSARAAQQRFENEQHEARLAEYKQFGND